MPAKGSMPHAGAYKLRTIVITHKPPNTRLNISLFISCSHFLIVIVKGALPESMYVWQYISAAAPFFSGDEG